MPDSNLNRCPNDYTSSTVKIRHLSKEIGYSLFTNTSFKPNDVLFEVKIPFSELRRAPGMHTIQVCKDWHWCTIKHPIQYTQHSCFNINCKFVLEDARYVASKHGNKEDGEFASFKLVALHHIEPETVVTVNYNSFEWEMSCCFEDSEAHREVRGYKFAKEDEQKFLNDNALLFKHIEEEIKTEQKRCPNNYTSSTIKIEHLSDDIGYSLFTNDHFKPNDVLFEVLIPFGEMRQFPDMHTIQVAKDWHWCTKNHPIQYTQHSCFDINCKFILEDITDSPDKETIGASNETGVISEENDYFVKFKLIALQHLNPNTVVTVNYNSFEWEMSCSFVDAQASSDTIDPKDINTENIISKSTKNGSGIKGREVMGYKFAKPDERKFLKDRNLLFRHVKEEILSELKNGF